MTQALRDSLLKVTLEAETLSGAQTEMADMLSTTTPMVVDSLLRAQVGKQ